VKRSTGQAAGHRSFQTRAKEEISQQLTNGVVFDFTFRLFIPVEVDSEQHIYIIDKDAQGNVTTKREYGVRYVPLTDAPE